jgi:hypothetical protein
MKGEFQTIELDCPPGSPRPGDLIKGVIEGLGIEPRRFDITPFFGCAEYVFDIDQQTWETKYQPTIKARVTALYNSGAIRYGSW